MGVKGLWGMIKNSAEAESPANKTLAVDISIWIHYFKDMQEKDIVYYISKRIIKLLYHNIKPVFIFDGPPNEMKKRVLVERKKINHEKLIRDIINNKKCKKCQKSIRTCRHGGILNEKIRNDLEAQIKTKLEDHDQRWGLDVEANGVTHTNLEEISPHEAPKNNKDKVKNVVIDEQLIYDIVKSHKLTRQQKLKMLLKMREKRKEKLGYDNNTLLGFSESQIVNIKKRNLISFYIRRLEKEKPTRIQSDCFKEFSFTKHKEEQLVEEKEEHAKDSNIENSDDSIYHLFQSEEEKIETQNKKTSKEKRSSKLDSLFEACSANLEALTTVNPENDGLVIDKSDSESESNQMKDFIAKVSNGGDKIGSGFFTSKDMRHSEISSSDIEKTIEIQEEEKYDYSLYKKSPKGVLLFDDNEENLDFSGTQTIMKNIIDVFQLPYLVPPGEADSQCGYLSAQNIVDGVITEDNDVLLYGGVVFRNFFRKNKPIEKFSPDRIQEVCGFSKEDLINISYVLGSDYTIGIHGVGVKKAVDFIKSDEFRSLDICQYSDIYLSPSVDKSFKPNFNIIDMKKIVKFFHYKGVDTEKITELLFYLKNIKKS